MKKKKEVISIETREEKPVYSIEVARADYVLHVISPDPHYTNRECSRLMKKFENRKYGNEFR